MATSSAPGSRRPPANRAARCVVIQEIFGVNAHIRAVTDSYAAEGYVAIAPALFDRVRRGIELGYNAETMKEGFGYVQQLQPEKTLLDLAACIAVVKHAGRVGVVGFCWGGKMAYLSACELPVACGVAYYGGGIAQGTRQDPQVPDAVPLRRQGHPHSGKATSSRSAPPIRAARFISIRKRITASTATCAPASMPRRRSWRASARWPSSRSTCAAKPHRPTPREPHGPSDALHQLTGFPPGCRAHRHPAGQYRHARTAWSCATSAATWQSS